MKANQWKYIFMVLSLLMVRASNAQVNLVKQHQSSYKIVLPQTFTKNEALAAQVLQQYIREISGAMLPIVNDGEQGSAHEISIGKTNRIKTPVKLNNDAFLIKTDGNHLVIYGEAEKATLYGVYHFLDAYLGCKKYSTDSAFVPKSENILLKPINDLQEPQFTFRQVYYPQQYNREYQDWHKLHHLEDEWGLWGHSFNKLVPASQYFATHPEYYALVNGERKDTQLCLSHPEVLKILTNNLAALIEANPDKKYWSVSQNDGLGYCTCPACAATDKKHGGPQGSLINFVNKVAAKFPEQTISTLAYLYSKHPPQQLKPRSNVSIMLSTIDLDRAKPIEQNPTSNGFRNDLAGWKNISRQVMIWDYVVQFTNYLSPFPNIETLRSNMNYFAKAGAGGVFIQGTENSLGEFSALKSYVLAKLSWQPDMKNDAVFDDFMQTYYGKAAPFIQQYQRRVSTELHKSNRMLDIYGEPTAEWNTWLTPAQIDGYSTLLDQAEKAVINKETCLKRVNAERLSLEFAVLQQARFYGLEKYGIFSVSGKNWEINKGFKAKVERFIRAAKAAPVKQLNEEGLTIEAYEQEWNTIFKEGPLLHLATRKKVKALNNYSTDYPAKADKTLTDGTRGYNNFQYNYLGWLANDMEVLIDLEKPQMVQSVIAGFLEDQRHWAFLPEKITVSVSLDNISFQQVSALKLPDAEENYDKETHRLRLTFDAPRKVRYLKITAKNIERLPVWRDFPNRKPWIFCDEIEVY